MFRRISVLDHVLALLHEKDLRDQQRFEAQAKAVDTALLAQQTAVEKALSSVEKAVTKAETATEKRFESVNEFRKTLSDQTASFPNRVELQALAERVADLATRLDKTEGRATGLGAGWTYLVGAVGLVAAVLTIILSR
jgi:hypothetical protein